MPDSDMPTLKWEDRYTDGINLVVPFAREDPLYVLVIARAIAEEQFGSADAAAATAKQHHGPAVAAAAARAWGRGLFREIIDVTGTGEPVVQVWAERADFA